MKIKQVKLVSFPENANPYVQDIYNMGTPFGKDLVLMHKHHATDECTYIILVNTRTGERVKLEIDMYQEEPTPVPCNACGVDLFLDGPHGQHCGAL